MKLRLPLLLALATLPLALSTLASTDPTLDSLMNQLHLTAQRADGAKSDSLAAVCADLSEYYAYTHIDSARYYGERGMAAVEQTPSAVHAQLLNNLAETYFGEGDMERAKELLSAAVAESHTVEACEVESSALSSLGVVYRRRNNPDSALICYNRAVGLAQQVGDLSTEGSLYVNIAVLYANMRRLPEAETYAEKGVETLLQTDDREMQLYAYQTQGSIEAVAKQFDKAARTLGSAFRLAERYEEPLFMVKCAAPLLTAFNHLNRRDSIARYVRLTEPVLAQIPPKSVEALGYRETLAQIELQAGHYAEALRIYRFLLALGENQAVPRHILTNRIALAQAGLTDYRAAFTAMHDAYDQLDSLSKADIQQQLSDFSARYDTQQKELEIVQLKQTQAEQRASKLRYIIWSMVLIVLLIILVSVLLYLRHRQNESARRREAEFDTFRRQTDLRLARKYIDGLEAERTRLAKELHDGVCSDLLGLEMHVRNASPTEDAIAQSADMLHRISDGVRNISHELMPPAMQYATIDEILEDYMLHLERPDRIRVEFFADPATTWSDIPSEVGYELYRILQELLSNILRHNNPTQIGVALSRTDRTLVCTVRDNGAAFDPRQRTRGIGQRTIADRLNSIGGEMTIDSNPEGSCITLKIRTAENPSKISV